jgi:hypothetical protein
LSTIPIPILLIRRIARDPFYTLVVGNYLVVASVGAQNSGKVKQADLEALLTSHDLAGIAKL